MLVKIPHVSTMLNDTFDAAKNTRFSSWSYTIDESFTSQVAPERKECTTQPSVTRVQGEGTVASVTNLTVACVEHAHVREP